MRTHARISRGLALASCGVLVTGLAFVAGPASALPHVQVYIAQGTSSAAAGCTVTSGSANSTVGPKNLHNGSAKGGVNLITTWTNGSDSSDIVSVNGHYSGTGHLTKKSGAFKSASITGSGSVSIAKAISTSTCDVDAQLLNAVEFTSTQPAGWYYITRSTSKGSLVEMVVSKSATLVRPALFVAYQGGANTVTERAFVSSGQYVTLLAAGIEAGDFPILLNKHGSVQRGSLRNTVTASFHKAGSSFSGASGAGVKFVRFPSSISCSGHKATLTWKASASQVASSTFFVNGKKKASVSSPKGGRRVVLKHLSATTDNTISVNLSLKSGGKSTATDLFVPCHE